MKSIIAAFSVTILIMGVSSAQTAPAPQPVKTEKYCYKVMKEGQIVSQCVDIPAGFKKGPSAAKPK